jgi:GntR family transcriptional regulator/MocR family aminotransferase
MTAGDTPDTVLAARAAAEGVLVHPLSWHRIEPGPPGLVLGYAAQPPDRLSSVGARLARAFSRRGR